MPVDFEAKLKELEEEKAELKAQLGAATDKDERLAIRQQLKANQDGQTALLSKLGDGTGASPRQQAVGADHGSFFSFDEFKRTLDIDETQFIDAGLAHGVQLSTMLNAAVPPVPTDGKEEQMQKWLLSVSNDLKHGLPITLRAPLQPVESLKLRSQPLKPDGVVYAAGVEKTPAGIVAVIELKKVGEALGEAHQLQLMKYLYAVLDNQPHRNYCYGVVTNGADVQIWKAARLPAVPGRRFCVQHQLIHSSSTFKEGAFIAWLLQMTLTEHGWSKLEVSLNNGSTYHLNSFIGSGQHCDAYELEVDGVTGQKVVMKHYRDAGKADQEREVCKLLNDVPNVASLASDKFQPKDKLFVAIQQRGHPFDSEHQMNKEHAKCLVQAVKALHAKGIAHCDIFGGNIYYLDANKAMLNDWSHVKYKKEEEEEEEEDEQFKELCVNDFTKLSQAVKNLGDIVDDAASTLITSTASSKRKRDAPSTPEKSPKKNADGAAAKEEE